MRFNPCTRATLPFSRQITAPSPLLRSVLSNLGPDRAALVGKKETWPGERFLLREALWMLVFSQLSKCQLITHSNSGLRMPILCSISLSFTGSGLRDTWKKSVDLPSVSRLRSKQKTGEPFSGVGLTWESIPPIFKATY